MTAPQHIATVAHGGRLWDAYLEFDDDRGDVFRACLRFDRADAGEQHEMVRTTVIIIEESQRAALEKALSFDERQLAGLLRSALPGG